MCPLFLMKPTPCTEEDDEIVDAVERLVSERRAGRALQWTELSPLAWELVILWDSVVESYERSHRERVSKLIETIVRMEGG